MYNIRIMLYLSTRLSDIPLLSIRSGGRIGTVLGPIINPNNLHIDGFYCTSAHTNETQILLDMYVRDLSGRGLIIDDHNNLSEPDELIRLQSIIRLNFSIIDKKVLVNKRRMGKVIEYAIDKESLFVQKFYVKPTILMSLKQARLTFDRQSVTEVTDAYIAFSGPEIKIGSSVVNKRTGFAPDYSASASTISE